MVKATTSYLIHIAGALVIFVMGIAVGVMLMQQDPRQPNLSLIKSMSKKTGVVLPAVPTETPVVEEQKKQDCK